MYRSRLRRSGPTFSAFASLLDTQAAAFFDESRLLDARREIEVNRHLFSGDGRHSNPEIATVASLIAARECDAYRMYSVNREGGPSSSTGRREPVDAEAPPGEAQEKAPVDDPHGARLDEFFQAEQPFNPNYRRVFRSATGGSVIIDRLNPVVIERPSGLMLLREFGLPFGVVDRDRRCQTPGRSRPRLTSQSAPPC